MAQLINMKTHLCRNVGPEQRGVIFQTYSILHPAIFNEYAASR